MGAKAAAGTGSIPLSSALVALVLYWFNAHPPQEIVLAYQAVASALFAYPAIYFTPHTP
jgi:hypothetical protein